MMDTNDIYNIVYDTYVCRDETESWNLGIFTVLEVDSDRMTK